MAATQIIVHGLFYGLVTTGYLFLCMITFSPRVWGYKDYPDRVKKKVPPQTKKEIILAATIGLPWLVFVLGFPVFSTFALKSKLGNEISFGTALLNVVIMFLLATFGDLVLLDWIVVSRITPKFVIIPGTVKEDYRDFSHHYKGHAKAAIPMAAAGLIIAGLVSFWPSDFPTLKGPYLSQKPPGLNPELFAPGIVSKGDDEATSVFSPDGKEFFYSAKMGPEKRLTIMTSKVTGETWTKPEVARFSGKYYDAVTSISPDGNSLFFNSMRPKKEGEPPFEVQHIWMMEKQGNEWRNPRMLPPPVNSDARELGGFMSKDGHFYFSTAREGEISGKCRVKVVNGEFTGIESLDSLYDFGMPCFEVARDPEEKFIVFVSLDQVDGYGKFDLYVSFKKGDNSWTTPRNLGDRINTTANEHFPSFSPDGQYMFFVSNRISAKAQEKPDSPMNGSSDIYWVSAKIIEELKNKIAAIDE